MWFCLPPAKHGMHGSVMETAKEEHALGAFPDIDGSGLSEILIATGGTNQGITWGTISILKLSGSQITKFGQTGTLSDDCGTNEKSCKMTANRIFVKVGSAPAFYREVFWDAAWFLDLPGPTLASAFSLYHGVREYFAPRVRV